MRSRRPWLRRVSVTAVSATALMVLAAPAGADDADQETNRWLGPLFVAIIFVLSFGWSPMLGSSRT